MTKRQKEKAVEVIEDVLKIIRLKGVEVRQQTSYLRAWYFTAPAMASLKEHLNALIRRPSKPCQVCAKGALFLGYVDKFNKVKVGPGLARGKELDHEAVCEPLTSIWPAAMLDKIEEVFEDDTICLPSGTLVSHPWGDLTHEDRLRAILKYMLTNNGEFLVNPEWPEYEE